MNSPKILVIDGEPKNLQILSESLVSAGFRVVTAKSGEIGWELIKTEKPDIIVSEVDIPGIDGFQLLDRLQKDSLLASIPLVFLTNRRNLEDRIKSLSTGVKDYMIKPLHVKEVIARLQMLLRRTEKVKDGNPETSKKIVGRLEENSVEYLLENYGVEKRTGILSLYDKHEQNGEIYFRDGAVVNARLGNFRAEKAVYQMLPWNHGHFIMTFKNINVQDEITVSNLGLLLQGFKRVSEREKMLRQLPGENAILVKTPLFEQILQRKTIAPDALNFIVLFDGNRTIVQVLSASKYDDIKTLRRIIRLYEQGFIMELGGKPAPTIQPPQPHTTEQKPAQFIKQHASPVANIEQKTPLPATPLVPPVIDQPALPRKEAPIFGAVDPLLTKPDRDMPPKSPRVLSTFATDSGTSGRNTASGDNQSNGNSNSVTEISQPGFNAVADACDQLFNGRQTSDGQLVVLSSNHQCRRQFVSTMTMGRFITKSIESSEATMDIGRILTTRKRTLEVIGLSTEQRFVQMLSQIVKSLVGYIILVMADNPENLKYTGYLINSIKKKIQAPYAVAVIRAADGRKVPLDFVSYSLQMDDDEQLVEIDVNNPGSLKHLISQLQSPSYRNSGAQNVSNMVQPGNFPAE